MASDAKTTPNANANANANALTASIVKFVEPPADFKMRTVVANPTVTVQQKEDPPAALDAAKLPPAESSDLSVGRVIYVRGRRAIIDSVDFPLVFWHFDGDAAGISKHRSFTDNPALFAVDKSDRKPATAGGEKAEFDAKYASDDDGRSCSPARLLTTASCPPALLCPPLPCRMTWH
jgi:hypothetical protein